MAKLSEILSQAGEEIIQTTKSQPNRDLKHFGKTIFAIGELGDKFHPEDFDLQVDLDKKLRTEYEKRLGLCGGLTKRQRRAVTNLINEISSFIEDGKPNEMDEKKISFVMQTMPFLLANTTRTFTEMAKRFFFVIFELKEELTFEEILD